MNRLFLNFYLQSLDDDIQLRNQADVTPPSSQPPPPQLIRSAKQKVCCFLSDVIVPVVCMFCSDVINTYRFVRFEMKKLLHGSALRLVQFAQPICWSALLFYFSPEVKEIVIKFSFTESR